MRFVFVLIALVLSAACQGARTGATDQLHPCQIAEGPPDAYCGTYRVFEKRSAASGRTIDLKIVVAPALRRDPKLDPLIARTVGSAGSLQRRDEDHRRLEVALLEHRGEPHLGLRVGVRLVRQSLDGETIRLPDQAERELDVPTRAGVARGPGPARTAGARQHAREEEEEEE